MLRTHSLSLLCLLAAVAAAPADPPAPAYTIYGTVRAEDGRPLDTGEGIVILSTDAGEIARGPTNALAGRGINYSLQLPMDSFTTGTLYKPNATRPDEGFKIRVLIGAKSHVPIEVKGRILAIGHPSERDRVDFTLGIDSDNDGLPDSWEKSLVDASPTDGLTSISQVTPGGDHNGNGLTNEQKFLYGIYGVGADDGTYLNILGLAGNIAHLQFRSSRGHTYSIRSSTDLKNWTELPISLLPNGANTGGYFRAGDSTEVDIYVPNLAPQPSRFFRLYVE